MQDLSYPWSNTENSITWLALMFMQGGLPGSSCLGWAAQCLASQQYVQSPPCCSTLSTLAPLGLSIMYVSTFSCYFWHTLPPCQHFFIPILHNFFLIVWPLPSPPPPKKCWRTLWMAPLCLGFCCPSLKVVTFAPFYVLKPKFLLALLLALTSKILVKTGSGSFSMSTDCSCPS